MLVDLFLLCAQGQVHKPGISHAALLHRHVTDQA